MICSAKQSMAAIAASGLQLRRQPPPRNADLRPFSAAAAGNTRFFSLSARKPLYLPSSSAFPEPRGLRFGRGAYEADRSEILPPISVESTAAAAQKVKIGIYFATWWSLNVVFNIYNKKVLNAFPYPWLTSLLSLAAGSLMMLISWATRIAEAPNTDLDFWKSLAPVALAHTIGHVAATVSMSKVAVSFTHIIKSSEPAFSVLVSRFLLGETFPLTVYLSLLPIIWGCGLAALTELNFNTTGFMGAMISNIAFVFRNIFSKKGMKGVKGKSVSGMNYYACLSLLSLLILTPFAVAVEGPQMWAAGWEKAVSDIGTNFVWTGWGVSHMSKNFNSRCRRAARVKLSFQVFWVCWEGAEMIWMGRARRDLRFDRWNVEIG